jgi:hypothetical protein
LAVHLEDPQLLGVRSRGPIRRLLRVAEGQADHGYRGELLLLADAAVALHAVLRHQ